MQTVKQDLLREAAAHLHDNTRLLNTMLFDQAPADAITSARKLVDKCDLLLSVALYRYLRGVCE